MKIKAALVSANSKEFEIADFELDDPRPDEVLVRIVASGMCYTDLGQRKGYTGEVPGVFGHEGAGVVERVGSLIRDVSPGDHVVLSYDSCGRCQRCLQGSFSYCDEMFQRNFGGSRLDGSAPISRDGVGLYSSFFGQSSFSSFSLATQRNVVTVPKDLPLEILGPLGCGVLTGAGSIINALKVPVGSSIAVFGTGAVGMSAILAARVVGCTAIIGIDLNKDRLQIARELGATHTLISSDNIDEEIRAILPRGVDYALDTTGNPDVYRKAIECLAPLGTCGLVGAPGPNSEVLIPMQQILIGRAERGIIMGDSCPQILIPQLIDLYRQDRFPFDRLIRQYPFESINEAADHSLSGATTKPVLQF